MLLNKKHLGHLISTGILLSSGFSIDAYALHVGEIHVLQAPGVFYTATETVEVRFKPGQTTYYAYKISVSGVDIHSLHIGNSEFDKTNVELLKVEGWEKSLNVWTSTNDATNTDVSTTVFNFFFPNDFFNGPRPAVPKIYVDFKNNPTELYEIRSVPEASTYAMLLAGLGLVGGMAVWRHKR